MPVKKNPKLVIVALLVLVVFSVYRMWPRTPVLLQTEVKGPTMGTLYTVKAVHPRGVLDADKIKEICEQILQDIDASMSTYRDDSELMRFNAVKANAPFAASQSLFDVMQHAQRISAQTDGYFDVTVGALVNAWGFGRNKIPSRPDDAALSKLMAQTGYDKIQMDGVARTFSKSTDDVTVDLSAIAPGYAADRIVDALLAAGAEGLMVDVGGEIRVAGTRADGALWQLGIESPAPEGREAAHVLVLRDKALATSGDYRNFRVDAEGRVVHGIDPHTGKPSVSNVASATVVTTTATEADALATAFMVAPVEVSWGWALDRKIAVLLMVRNADGTLDVKRSPAFDALIQGND